jgi:hypothetical protein
MARSSSAFNFFALAVTEPWDRATTTTTTTTVTHNFTFGVEAISSEPPL